MSIATLRLTGRPASYTPEEDAAIRAAKTRDDLRAVAARIGRTLFAVDKRAVRLKRGLGRRIDWDTLLPRVAEMRRAGATLDEMGAAPKVSRHTLNRVLGRLNMKEKHRPGWLDNPRQYERDVARRWALVRAAKDRKGGESLTRAELRELLLSRPDATRAHLDAHAGVSAAGMDASPNVTAECVKLYRKAWRAIRRMGAAS